jgi:cytochrome c peroxidase
MQSDKSKPLRAFKTPSLREVLRRKFFVHAGQFKSLEQVIDHFDKAPIAPSAPSELQPLHLGAKEKQELLAFLHLL